VIARKPPPCSRWSPCFPWSISLLPALPVQQAAPIYRGHSQNVVRHSASMPFFPTPTRAGAESLTTFWEPSKGNMAKAPANKALHAEPKKWPRPGKAPVQHQTPPEIRPASAWLDPPRRTPVAQASRLLPPATGHRPPAITQYASVCRDRRPALLVFRGFAPPATFPLPDPQPQAIITPLSLLYMCLLAITAE